MGWNLTEIEKAWLACAIDGEGSLSFENSPYGLIPRLNIYNTNRDFLDHAAKLMNRKLKSWKKKLTIQHHPVKEYKECYRVRVSGKPCIGILKEVLPYLIIKKERAILAIAQEPSLKTNVEHLALINTTITPHLQRDSLGKYVGGM